MVKASAQDDGRATEDPLLQWLGTGWARWAYECTMIALALVVVVLLARPDRGVVRVANLTIWGVFLLDYLVRLGLAEDRRAFVRRNVPDLIAVLPLDFFRVARVARLGRLARLFRAGAVLWRASTNLRAILRTNGLQWVLAVATMTITIGGLVVWALDPEIASAGDGIWWAIVTSTTVGYGDLSPTAPVARGVAVVIMIVGVGTIGMLTGSIATYFTGEATAGDVANPQVAFVRDRLAAWEELSPTDRRELAAMLAALADRETATA